MDQAPPWAKRTFEHDGWTITTNIVPVRDGRTQSDVELYAASHAHLRHADGRERTVSCHGAHFESPESAHHSGFSYVKRDLIENP